MRRTIGPIPEGADLAGVARAVRYVGSAEHKEGPSFAGQPRPRADASICPQELTERRETIQEWLREAVSRGAVSGLFEQGFPRYAWYKDGSTVYEARLVNRGQGEYKGYPLEEVEWPQGIVEVYG